MLNMIELEKNVIDAIIAHTSSFDNTNIILMPANTKELAKPFLGLQSLGLRAVGRKIDHPIDEGTGEREVTQHYEWVLRFTAVGDGDIHRQLTVSSLSLIQELILQMSTYLFQADLEADLIFLQRVGDPRRVPQIQADEWVDKSIVDVTFGLSDVTTEFISFIETVDYSGTYIRYPDDPNPIEST